MHNQPIIQLVNAPLPSELIAHRYEVVRVLGSGAFGTVYHCLDTQLARLPVALKFFHAHTLKSTLTQTRIHRELRACFKVQHDNTIFFYDTVRDAENFGFTMELIDGNPLTKLCTPEFQPSFTQTLEILKQTTLGLRAIHKCKIIHRDLKPANVLLSRNGIVKVTDFGLARRPLDGIDCSHEISAAFSKLPDACVTASSHLVGSPAYICPHYLKTQQFTHLCDLYAIGMIGFELLTVRRPFDESSTKQLLLNKMQKDAPNAAEFNPQIPLSLSELIATLLQREPSKRYQSCDQILDVIENCKSEIAKKSVKAERITEVAQPLISPLKLNENLFRDKWSAIDLIELLRMRCLPSRNSTLGSFFHYLVEFLHPKEVAVLITLLFIALLGLGFLRTYLVENDIKLPFYRSSSGTKFFTPTNSKTTAIVVKPEGK